MAEAELIAERKPYKEYEKPAEGTYHAVISEVEDLGMVTRPGFQGAPPKTGHEIKVWWQLDAKDKEGRIFRVPERAMLLSLHEKSNLFKFIKNLFSKEPPTSFDVRKLVGTERNVVIQHRNGTGEKANQVYANVAAVLKLPANAPKLTIVPRQKKDEVKAEVAAGLKQAVARPVTEADPINSEDVPF